MKWFLKGRDPQAEGAWLGARLPPLFPFPALTRRVRGPGLYFPRREVAGGLTVQARFLPE